VSEAGAKSLSVGEAEPLGDNVIHSVNNPIPRLTAALHVYGGDFFNSARRSEWDPETLMEQPFDADRAIRRFEDANKLFAT
jgi:predicted metal-dependent enzyme (double-stranded beta helix superfamily)